MQILCRDQSIKNAYSPLHKVGNLCTTTITLNLAIADYNIQNEIEIGNYGTTIRCASFYTKLAVIIDRNYNCTLLPNEFL